ncbi:40S ribosomal protein S5-1 [Hordeum vulgare]|nr:40S ribosomal protein S5-1 [Hordeum vulgare]
MTGSVEARLEAMEQQVFKCQGMVEHGLNANHMMITEFSSKHKIDANDIGKHLSRLYARIDHLQAQIYDLQNQNCRLKLDHGRGRVGRWRDEGSQSLQSGTQGAGCAGSGHSHGGRCLGPGTPLTGAGAGDHQLNAEVKTAGVA